MCVGMPEKDVSTGEQAQMALSVFYTNEVLTSHKMMDNTVSTNSNQRELRKVGGQLG